MLTRRSLLSGSAALAVVSGTARTGAATPASPVPNDDPGGLSGLLARAPDVLDGGGAASSRLATYANLAAQLAAVGAAVPPNPADPGVAAWSRAAASLEFTGPVAQFGLQPDWRAAFGFDLLQVDQSLALGEPPATLTLLRGRFDPRAIRAALTKSGYQPVAAAGAVVLSLHADPQADLSSVVGAMTLGALNNVALLADGTLVACGALTVLQTALAAAAGQAASLAQQPLVAALLAGVPAPLASAVVVAGAVLGGLDPAAMLGANGAPTAEQLATQTAELARMPPVALALIGTTLGGPLPPLTPDATPESSAAGQPSARCLVVLLLTDQAAATTAAAVINERLGAMVSLTTGRRYVEDFPNHTIRVAPEAPVVVVELVPGPGRVARLIFDRLDQRDLLFVAW
jgi:hypothetical protein